MACVAKPKLGDPSPVTHEKWFPLCSRPTTVALLIILVDQIDIILTQCFRHIKSPFFHIKLHQLGMYAFEAKLHT